MTTLEITEALLFETHKGNANCKYLDFRGFRISYIDRFYLQRKEATSRGAYVQEINILDCTNKKTKATWYLIRELLELSKNKDWDIEYIDVVQKLLVEMFFNNSTKVRDDGRYSGNQYDMAKESYTKIKEDYK